MESAALLEGWLRRARAAFGQLSGATSPIEARRYRLELIDAVGALLGIESMIARHRRGRAHVDLAAHAAKHTRVRLALLRIATAAPSERRHRLALSTIRAALWEDAPTDLSGDALDAKAAADLAPEVACFIAALWPLGEQSHADQHNHSR